MPPTTSPPNRHPQGCSSSRKIPVRMGVLGPELLLHAQGQLLSLAAGFHFPAASGRAPGSREQAATGPGGSGGLRGAPALLLPWIGLGKAPSWQVRLCGSGVPAPSLSGGLGAARSGGTS